MGKLITSPVLRLVEEPTTHIFSLNDTWLHVIQKLEEFSTNAEPLLEGAEIVLNGKVTKDEIYDELLKDTMDSELDDLTEECLGLLCCSSAILLHRQLQDQLPGGKHHQPSQEVMGETTGAPKQNIISECDFAQLDRQLDHKPSISTVSVSGLICFMNNKTPQCMESLPDKEKSAMITRALAEKASYRLTYKERKRMINEKKVQQMNEKRKKQEKSKVAKEKKEHLDISFTQIGGLWRTKEEMNTKKCEFFEGEWK